MNNTAIITARTRSESYADMRDKCSNPEGFDRFMQQLLDLNSSPGAILPGKVVELGKKFLEPCDVNSAVVATFFHEVDFKEDLCIQILELAKTIMDPRDRFNTLMACQSVSKNEHTNLRISALEAAFDASRGIQIGEEYHESLNMLCVACCDATDPNYPADPAQVRLNILSQRVLGGYKSDKGMPRP